MATNFRFTRITHNSIATSWDPSSGATSYAVAREYFPFSPFWRDVGNVTSYTFLVRGTREIDENDYDIFYVRAVNSGGHSDANSFLLHWGDIPKPPQPRDGTADGDGDDEPYIPKPTPTPIHDTLNHLPPGIQVSNWRDGAQGQQVNHIGVGRADLVARGILNAVDLWGYITPGIEVCFAQHGRVVFLDAAYMPRQLFDLPAYSRDGMTCATIDRAGTVVLLRGEPPPEIPPDPSQPQILNDCEVWPWENVNFRESPPDGPVISVTGLREWLPASEKQHGYFKVRLWEREGWISGDYVYTRGGCGG
ncbi:MAG: hypothetical protein OXG92_09760 [Chloroflexi bacterium]|nr:hypothetical protein [Chloroflexota bacterium]MCY3583469.1 hypothetical protein [Chloroflexota bacterium]MCY3716735.1 hypothetical protein [Chloroflexota bacterium]